MAGVWLVGSTEQCSCLDVGREQGMRPHRLAQPYCNPEMGRVGGHSPAPPRHCQWEDSILVFWRGRASLELCSLFQDQNRRLVGSCHGFQQSSSGNPQHAHLDLGVLWVQTLGAACSPVTLGLVFKAPGGILHAPALGH